MKNLPLRIVVLLAGAAVFAPLMALAAETTGQEACKLDRTIRVQMKYLLYLPKDYDQKGSWPLLLFLHGSGGRYYMDKEAARRFMKLRWRTMLVFLAVVIVLFAILQIFVW